MMPYPDGTFYEDELPYAGGRRPSLESVATEEEKATTPDLEKTLREIVGRRDELVDFSAEYQLSELRQVIDAAREILNRCEETR